MLACSPVCVLWVNPRVEIGMREFDAGRPAMHKVCHGLGFHVDPKHFRLLSMFLELHRMGGDCLFSEYAKGKKVISFSSFGFRCFFFHLSCFLFAFFFQILGRCTLFYLVLLGMCKKVLAVSGPTHFCCYRWHHSRLRVISRSLFKEELRWGEA